MICDHCESRLRDFILKSNHKKFCSGECYDNFFGYKRGEFVATGARISAQFGEYYDGTLKKRISSFRQQDRLVKEHNKKAKDGIETRELCFAQDHRSFNDMKKIHRHKKEYLYERYKQSGKNPETLTKDHKRWLGLDKKRRYYY